MDRIKNANWFSIMADETCDVANIEQLSFFVRYISKDLKTHESFIGMHEVENTKSEHLVNTIKKILEDCNFDFNKIRGQCYDKAASMSGEKSGVKTRILIENDKALWIHCFNHALNLAVLDTLTQIPLFKDSISFSEELLILLKKSSKRQALLLKLKIAKGKKTRGVKSFAKTRWTVKGQSFDTIIINYTEILETFQESLQEETKTDMKSRINGVMHQMTKFNFFYGICLARKILFVTDILAKSLQTKNLSAVEGKEMYQITANLLEKMKKEDFEKFWNETVELSDTLDIGAPELKRKKKTPKRLKDFWENEEEKFDESPKEHYKKIFDQAFELILEGFKQRFEQKN